VDEETFADEFDFLARTTGTARYGLLLDLVPPHADRALDAGCGTGILTMGLARRVRHVVGLDVSRPMLAVAEKHRAENTQDNVCFVLGDLEALPFGEPSFDFVVAVASLQRTRLPVTLPGLRRLVTPGGRLALYVNVLSLPRLRDWRPVRVLMNLRQAMQYVNAHGVRTAWRLLRFPAGHGCGRGRRSSAFEPDVGESGNGRSIPRPFPPPRRCANCASGGCPGAGWRGPTGGR
jgi:SAM-dependent methyltransferase